MTLCFGPAFWRWKWGGTDGISRQQYFDHILAHLKGVRHEQDRSPDDALAFSSSEPWLVALRETALKDNYQPLTNTTKWSILLKSCVNDDLDVFTITLDSMGPSPNPDPTQPLACLAAQYGHHRILRHCMTRGVTWDSTLNICCERGATSVEMAELLYAGDWRGIRTDPRAAGRQIDLVGRDTAAGMWWRSKTGSMGAGARVKAVPGVERTSVPVGIGCNYTAEQIDKWFGDVDW